MTLYRRRPVLVEAWQWLPYGEQEFPETVEERPEWIEEALERWPEVGGIIIYEHEPISIIASAGPGDWILKDAKGELSTCKPEIFEEIYEKWEGDV